MLEARIENALNDQIAMECTASFVYLSMANWCEQEGLGGVGLERRGHLGGARRAAEGAGAY